MDFSQKEHLSNMVKAACSMEDISVLKKLLPTAESLVGYRDMSNGGSFLHTLMYSHLEHPVAFLDEVIKEYGLDENIELKKQLFLKRNSRGKYAADFTYVYPYLAPEVKIVFEAARGKDVSQMTDVTDNRSKFEKEKVALYLELKKHIQSFDMGSARDVAFGVSRRYGDASDNSFDAFPKGTPVSDAMYIPDKEGKPALYVLGSIQEEYPEIRLLNYANEKEGIKENISVLRGIKLNSKETFLSQAIDKMDFPEDFYAHFHTLQVFEEDYKRLNNDAGKNAMYQYFTQNRGAVVFETEQQRDFASNSKSNGYGGYVIDRVTKENGKDVGYPIIVLPSGNQFGVQDKYDKNDKSTFANIERKLYHELFHAIDLSGTMCFSEMPIFRYAMMLEECNPKGKFGYIYGIINRHYESESYNLESAAYIMGVANKDVLADSPLLSKVYELGECFAIAKQKGDKRALGCLMTATDRFPDNRLLRIEHMRFMANKEQGAPFEISEDKRQFWESRLIQLMDRTIKKMTNMQNGNMSAKGKDVSR